MRLTKEIIRWMIEQGIATDVTGAERLYEPVISIAYSVNRSGFDGMIFRGLESGTLYAFTKRTALMMRLI